MAARQTSIASRRVNHRAWLSAFWGAVAVIALPVAIWLTRKLPGTALLDAAWAIPVGIAAGIGGLLFARGASGTIARSLERAGGARWIRAGRILAIAGICIALSAAIAVGFYELLLRLEK